MVTARVANVESGEAVPTYEPGGEGVESRPIRAEVVSQANETNGVAGGREDEEAPGPPFVKLRGQKAGSNQVDKVHRAERGNERRQQVTDGEVQGLCFSPTK